MTYASGCSRALSASLLPDISGGVISVESTGGIKQAVHLSAQAAGFIKAEIDPFGLEKGVTADSAAILYVVRICQMQRDAVGSVWTNLFASLVVQAAALARFGD